MNKPLKDNGKCRIATYLERDLIEWIKEESEKRRLTESAFIRQLIAERMTGRRA